MTRSQEPQVRRGGQELKRELTKAKFKLAKTAIASPDAERFDWLSRNYSQFPELANDMCRSQDSRIVEFGCSLMKELSPLLSAARDGRIQQLGEQKVHRLIPFLLRQDDSELRIVALQHVTDLSENARELPWEIARSETRPAEERAWALWACARLHPRWHRDDVQKRALDMLVNINSDSLRARAQVAIPLISVLNRLPEHRYFESSLRHLTTLSGSLRNVENPTAAESQLVSLLVRYVFDHRDQNRPLARGAIEAAKAALPESLRRGAEEAVQEMDREEEAQRNEQRDKRTLQRDRDDERRRKPAAPTPPPPQSTRTPRGWASGYCRVCGVYAGDSECPRHGGNTIA